MTQALILSILKNLGGQATQRQVEVAAMPHFPAYKTLLTYKKEINRKLNKLRYNGEVRHEGAMWIVKQ
jgi:hypothetical protein